MKKNLLSLIILMSIASLMNAQPVLNYDASHSIGSAFDVYVIGGSSANLFNSGANTTWDLSTNPLTVGGTVNLIAASQAPQFSSYSNTNLAYEQISGAGTAYNYMIDDANELNMTAERITGVSGISYNDYEKLLQYPFAFGDAFTDTKQAGSGSIINITRTYDSYGTLIINGKTYSNVVRIYESNTSSIWYSSTPLVTPIITIGTTGTLYLEPTTFTGIQDVKPSPSVMVHPNPSSGNVNFILNGISDLKNISLKVFNGLGSELRSLNVSSLNTNVRLDDQASGIYFYVVEKDNTVLQSGKFIVR